MSEEEGREKRRRDGKFLFCRRRKREREKREERKERERERRVDTQAGEERRDTCISNIDTEKKGRTRHDVAATDSIGPLRSFSAARCGV